MNPESKPWLAYLPALAGAALYLLAVGHGFVLDDDLVLTLHDHVQAGFAGIGDILSTNYTHGHQGFNDGLYRPLSLITFAIEKSLFNLNPAVSHFIQAILYGGLLIAIYRFVAKITTAQVALWATLLFAVHPIHTEVVANLKSRDEILALLFFALSANALLDWLGKRKYSDLATFFGLLLLSFFSKESAITYLAIFPLLLFMIGEKERSSWITTIGLSLLSAGIFLSVRQVVLTNMGAADEGIQAVLQNSLLQTDSLLDRLSTAAVIQWIYISKILVPINLTHDYSYNVIPITPLFSVKGILASLSIVAILIFGAVGTLKRKLWGFGILFYFLTVSVVANVFIMIGATAAERFVFSPSLGICLAIMAIPTWSQLKKMEQPLRIGLVAVFALLCILRIPDWDSNYSLFRADISKVPESARAHYNLGSASIDQAKANPREKPQYLNDAITHLNRAIEIWPEYQDAYNNLGITYIQMQDYGNAKLVYQRLLKAYPEYSKGYYNLASACYNLQDYPASEMHFETYLKTNPKSADALYFTAESEGFQGKFEEAKAHLNALIAIEPQRNRGFVKLGLANAMTGNAAEAEKWLLKAKSLTPTDPDVLVNLVLVHLNSGRKSEALAMLGELSMHHPNHPRLQSLQQEVNNLP